MVACLLNKKRVHLHRNLPLIFAILNVKLAHYLTLVLDYKAGRNGQSGQIGSLE